jgi:hypothetical protein
MKRLIIILIILGSGHIAYSQGDKPVVGVSEFTTEVKNERFVNAVYNRVVQVITNTHRFTLLDLMGAGRMTEELKSEMYLDSKNAQKDIDLLTMQYMIIGHVIKTNIYTIKNSDGSIKGYKASASFTLKVNDIESGRTTEAESFETEVSPLAMSKEQAVNQTLQSVEPALEYYFSRTFPLTTHIVRILTVRRNGASSLLIAGGSSYGFSVGDVLSVEHVELLDGKPYPTLIGRLRVTKTAGDFSECDVTHGGKHILPLFESAEQLNCKLITE